jgi:hypothetical protein
MLTILSLTLKTKLHNTIEKIICWHFSNTIQPLSKCNANKVPLKWNNFHASISLFLYPQTTINVKILYICRFIAFRSILWYKFLTEILEAPCNSGLSRKFRAERAPITFGYAISCNYRKKSPYKSYITMHWSWDWTPTKIQSHSKLMPQPINSPCNHKGEKVKLGAMWL